MPIVTACSPCIGNTAPTFASAMSAGIDPESLLQSGFEGDILRPGDQAYEDANKRWSKLIERKAGLVVQPRNSDDVAKAVQFAVSHHHQVVVKGGGHGGFASSSTEGGVVIDLAAHLHSIEVDQAAQTMTVGGGTRWSEIDKEAYKYGLAVVGPTHADVGVGGFVLGGGYGGLTGKMGLGCDQLIRATLVTADGTVLEVDEGTESKLLWGLRGAGCNFGAVTSLTLRLHPEPKQIFGGTLIFPGPKFPIVYKAVNDFRQNQILPEDSVGLVLAQGPNGPAVILNLAHHAPDVERAKTHFKPLFELGHILDNTKLTTNPEVNTAADAVNPPGRYVYSLSATHDKSSSEASAAVLDVMTEVWKTASFARSSMIVSLWNTTALMSAEAREKSCFGTRGEWGNVLIVIVWDPRDDTEEVRLKARESAYALKQAWASPHGAIAYGNPESDQGLGDARTRQLFGEGYPRLQKLKAKWDPNQVWGSWFPITPASS